MNPPAVRRPEIAAVVLVLVAYALLALGALREKGNFVDEIVHVTAGYSYWTTGEYRFHPENGNLPQRIAAIPLLGRGYAWPDPERPEYRASDAFAVGHRFFYGLGNDVGEILRLSRTGMVFIGLSVGFVVWSWSRRLFGPAGGLISLLMFAFCPTMLAHGPLATSDMTAALFFLLSAGAVWSVLQNVSAPRLAAAGAALGGLFLSKFSGILILPVAGALAAIRVGRGPALPVRIGPWRTQIGGRGARLGILCASLLVIGLMAWGSIWAAYGFRYRAAQPPSQANDRTPFRTPWNEMGSETPVTRAFVDGAARLRLLPEAYLYGYLHTLHYAQRRGAFLHGEVGGHGWWWFFPYAVLVKTPLSVFALAIAAAALGMRRAARGVRPGDAENPSGGGEALLYRTAPLWGLLAVYWAAAVTSRLNIGHRHVLLTYPVAYILCGALGPLLWDRSRRGRAIAAGLLFALAVESGTAYPHYLAFFNRAAGGPSNGYRHLVDSSLDWGQDLPGLKRLLERIAPAGPDRPAVHLAYFGTSSPDHYRIDARRLPGSDRVTAPGGAYIDLEFTGGVYAISATHLQSLYLATPGPWSDRYEETYQWLRPLHAAIRDTRDDPGAREALLREIPGKSLDAASGYFASLRLARLCAWLRQRQRAPDDQAGHSILVFRLGEGDLREALEGPMPVDPLVLHRRFGEAHEMTQSTPR